MPTRLSGWLGLLLAVALAGLFAAPSAAQAAAATDWTYVDIAGSYNWSDGAKWDAGAPELTTPTTTLRFFCTDDSGGGSLIPADSSAWVLTNNIGAFSLNQLTLGGQCNITTSRTIAISNTGGGSLALANGGTLSLTAQRSTANGRDLGYTLDKLTLSGSFTIDGSGTSALTFQTTSAVFTDGGAGQTITFNYSGGGAGFTFGAGLGSIFSALGKYDYTWAGTSAKTLSLNGGFTLTGDRIFDAPYNLTLAGNIIGNYTLEKRGAGTLTLAGGANAFGGPGKTLTISNGTVSVGGTGNLGDSNNTVTLNGGMFRLTSGTATLSRAFVINDVAGNTIIPANNGALLHTYDRQFTGGGSLRLGAGNDSDKWIRLSNTSNSFGGPGQTLALTNAGGNPINYVVADDREMGDSHNTITLDGNARLHTNSSYNLGRTVSIGSGGTFSVGDGGTLTVSGTLSGTGTITANTTTNMAGNTAAGPTSKIVFSGDYSGFTGGFSVQNGTVQLGGTGDNFTFGLLGLANTAGVLFDLKGHSATFMGITTGGANGGNIQGNATGAANTLTIDTTGADRSYDGVISDGGAVALNVAKSGSNNLTLTRAHTYTGTTTINAGGKLIPAVNDALGTAGGNTVVNSYGALSFSAPAAVAYSTAEPVTLNGTGVGGGGGIESQTTSNSFAGPITLASASSIGSLTAAQTLTLSGGINAAGSDLSLIGAGDMAITTTGISGAGSNLTKSGLGTLTLSVPSSFGGSGKTITIISAGRLSFSANDQLGASDNSITLEGGELLATLDVTTGRNFVLTADSTVSAAHGKTLIVNGTLSGSSTLTIGSTGNDGTVIFNGDTSGFTGAVTITAGAFDMHGNSITMGGIAGSGNIINSVASSPMLTLASVGTNPSYAGAISLSTGTINVTKKGNYTQTLTADNTYAGTTAIYGGGVIVSGSGKLSGTSAVTVSGGGTLTLSNSAGALNDAANVTLGGAGMGGGNLAVTASETIGQVSLGPGLNTVNTSAGQTTTIPSLGTRATGAAINFASGGTNRFTTPPTLTNGMIGGWATCGSGTSSRWASIVSNNVVQLATETAGGGTNPNTWVSSNNILLAAVPSGSLTAAITINSLRDSLTTNTTILTMSGAGALTLGTGGLMDMGGSGNTRTITGGTLSATGNELFVHIPTSTDNLTVASGLTLTTSGVLTKTGSGNLNLSYPVNQVADFYLHAGTVSSSANGALGASAGTLNLYGGALSFTSLTVGQTYANKSLLVGATGGTLATGAVTTSSTYTLGDGTHGGTLNGLLTLTPTSSSGTTRGTIDLEGALSSSAGAIGALSVTALANTKLGGVTLSSNNSFAGGVAINGGATTAATSNLQLTLGHNNALGSGVFTIGGFLPGSNFIAASTPLSAIPNAVAANSGFVLAGTNAMTFTGPVTIGDDVTITTSPDSGTPLYTFSGPIDGLWSLTKAGAGTLVISNAGNTYSGTTTVSEGTLLVNGTLAKSVSPVMVSAGATLGGNGSIYRPVGYEDSPISGTLSPGAAAGSVGTLTVGKVGVTRDVTFGSGGKFLVDVTTISSDLLAVNGSLEVTGATLQIAGGSSFKAGTVYVIATCTGTLSGTLAPGNLPAGWSVDCNVDLGQVRLLESPTMSVTNVQPPSGPAVGGTLVTVTGTGFVTGATVVFGTSTVSVLGTVAGDGLSLTCNTPPGIPGPAVRVTVTNTDAFFAFKDSAYTYTLNPAPTGIAVDPNAGSRSGGQHVTVTGSGFLSGATVTFDTSTVASNFVNGGALTCVTPAHGLGPVNVTVTNPYGGTSTPATYTYFEDWEGDVAPRDTGGDGAVSIVDWVQIGRFAALLDPVVNGPEFQKADCADRGASGDGVLGIADWVQAGRYAAALDPLQTMGGPTAPTP